MKLPKAMVYDVSISGYEFEGVIHADELPEHMRLALDARSTDRLLIAGEYTVDWDDDIPQVVSCDDMWVFSHDHKRYVKVTSNEIYEAELCEAIERKGDVLTWRSDRLASRCD